jgi:hypothetical protein
MIRDDCLGREYGLVYALCFPDISGIKIGATINFSTRPKLLQTRFGPPDFKNSFFLQMPCKNRFEVEQIFKSALRLYRIPKYGFEVFPLKERDKVIGIAKQLSIQRKDIVLSYWTLENWEHREYELQREKLKFTKSELKERKKFFQGFK